MQHKYMEFPGGTIHYWVSYKEEGAPWLIFLPGLSADHTLFDPQMAYFSAEYNCLTWDAAAHGLSRPFPLTFTMEDMAHQLHAVLEEEGVSSPILVGQSLGGYISQVYMDLYPGSVSGFVSIDSCSLSRKYYSSLELAMLKNTGWMYRSIPWKMLLKWGILGTTSTEYGRALLEKMWSVYGREEYCALSDHGSRIFAEAVERKPEYSLHCPVLLLCGKKDIAGSAKSYNRRWTKQERYPLIWIKGAGHNANTDDPETVNLHIDTFVKEKCMAKI